jgi:hypothetical protein
VPTRTDLLTLSIRSRAYAAGVLVAGLLTLTACEATDRWPAAPSRGDARLQRAGAVVGPAALQSAADPIGDTLGAGAVQLDLTALTVAPDGDDVVFTLDFAQDLPQPVAGWSPTITGLIELDLDQNPATGRGASMDILHRFLARGVAAGTGVDAAVGLAPLDADFTAPVYDATDRVVGRVKPVFEARRVTLRVPRALLANDDGRFDATVLIGNGAEVTDFAPSDGHFTFDTFGTYGAFGVGTGAARP